MQFVYEMIAAVCATTFVVCGSLCYFAYLFFSKNNTKKNVKERKKLEETIIQLRTKLCDAQYELRNEKNKKEYLEKQIEHIGKVHDLFASYQLYYCTCMRYVFQYIRKSAFSSQVVKI